MFSPASAELLFVVGRGADRHDDVPRILALAEQYGAQVGATRPVCMSGILPMDHLIGVSGHEVSPRCTVTFGVSGALAFWQGIRRSQKIICINTDADAPLSRKADFYVESTISQGLDALEKANL